MKSFLGYGIDSRGTFALTKQTYSTLVLSTANYKLTAALKGILYGWLQIMNNTIC